MVETIHLKVPMTAEDALRLRAGDVVAISGSIVTGRDRVHRYLKEHQPGKQDIPFDLAGTIIYHCGPVMQKAGSGYRVIAAGPTTSMRVELYEPDVIRAYQIRGVMGKGGMGRKTLDALRENACVYLHTFGGAAVYLADRIKKTLGVWKFEEFGPTEAMWQFQVEEFPAIVTMDAHGNDIHQDIESLSFSRFKDLIQTSSAEIHRQ